MNFKRTTIQCPCCDKEFSTEYHHGGSIEHENTLSNLGVFVSRWNSGWNKDDLFLHAINLDGNHCNIKDNTFEVSADIFKCVLLWMQGNKYEEIYDYLKSREGEIKEKYNAVIEENIRELEEQIKSQKARLEIQQLSSGSSDAEEDGKRGDCNKKECSGWNEDYEHNCWHMDPSTYDHCFEPLKSKTEPVAEVPCSDGLVAPVVDDEMLVRALSKAIEVGLLPAYGPQDQYLKNWDRMKEVLQTAVGN